MIFGRLKIISTGFFLRITKFRDLFRVHTSILRVETCFRRVTPDRQFKNIAIYALKIQFNVKYAELKFQTYKKVPWVVLHSLFHSRFFPARLSTLLIYDFSLRLIHDRDFQHESNTA
jgi:hypothetical protein